MNTRAQRLYRATGAYAIRLRACFSARLLARALIRGYQIALSPWLGGNCRFYPSCSHYALEAVQRHGVARGSWLTFLRICKCHPFHPGGVDLVPEPTSKRG